MHRTWYLLVFGLALVAACSSEESSPTRRAGANPSPAGTTAVATAAPSSAPLTIGNSGCAGGSTTLAAVPAATPPAGPNPDLLIAADPKDLILGQNDLLPGASFKFAEGAIVTAQWNRAWDRTFTGAADQGGLARVTMNGSLTQTLAEAVAVFAESAVGQGGYTAVQGAIKQRGFEDRQICVTQFDFGPLAVDQAGGWRAEFKNEQGEAWVDYWVFLRQRNIRAIVQTNARMEGGVESPRALDETRQVIKKQADLLRALKPAERPAPPTATPRPN